MKTILAESVELHQSLAVTDIGQVLLQRPRFGAFKPPETSLPEWEQMMGIDVNNFRHNILTAALGYFICASEGASYETTRNVVMTATVHDIGERLTGNSTTGDIPHGLAVEADEAMEHSYLQLLGADKGCAITPEIAQLAEATMLDSKKERNTPEGKIFWLTEKLGYFGTAMMAFTQYKAMEEGSDLKNNLLQLWTDVFGNSYRILVNEYENFASIRDFFEGNYAELDEMYALSLDHEEIIEFFYDNTVVGGRRYDKNKELSKIADGYQAHLELGKRFVE